MSLPRVRFTVRRLMVAVVGGAVLMGAAAALLESASPTAYILQWAEDHPDQPKPEMVGEGTSGLLAALFWLATALWMAIIAAVLLWPAHSVPPDPE